MSFTSDIDSAGSCSDGRLFGRGACDEAAHAARGDEQPFVAQGCGRLPDRAAGHAELRLQLDLGDEVLGRVVAGGDALTDYSGDLFPLGACRVEGGHTSGLYVTGQINS